MIAGGGGTSSAGNFSLDGTLGEVSASDTQSGGAFTLNGGFWNMPQDFSSTPTPSPSPSPSPTPTPTPTPTTTAIQFSASLYVVGEGDQRVTLTVTRSGDTSAAASVGFVTSDNAGSQSCNVFNGNASSRCDYLTSIGPVQFAAGETSKTFSIPIIDDSAVPAE